MFVRFQYVYLLLSYFSIILTPKDSSDLQLGIEIVANADLVFVGFLNLYLTMKLTIFHFLKEFKLGWKKLTL